MRTESELDWLNLPHLVPPPLTVKQRVVIIAEDQPQEAWGNEKKFEMHVTSVVMAPTFAITVYIWRTLRGRMLQFHVMNAFHCFSFRKFCECTDWGFILCLVLPVVASTLTLDLTVLVLLTSLVLSMTLNHLHYRHF